MRMCLVNIGVGHLVAVGPVHGGLLYACKLRQFGESAQHVHHVRVGEVARAYQFAQVLYGRWNRVDEMLLLLIIATEAVGSKHLHGTEQHKEAQAIDKMARRGHLGIVFQRVVVFVNQLAAQLVGIFCRSLP